MTEFSDPSGIESSTESSTQSRLRRHDDNRRPGLLCSRGIFLFLGIVLGHTTSHEASLALLRELFLTLGF